MLGKVLGGAIGGLAGGAGLIGGALASSTGALPYLGVAGALGAAASKGASMITKSSSNLSSGLTSDSKPSEVESVKVNILEKILQETNNLVNIVNSNKDAKSDDREEDLDEETKHKELISALSKTDDGEKKGEEEEKKPWWRRILDKLQLGKFLFKLGGFLAIKALLKGFVSFLATIMRVFLGPFGIALFAAVLVIANWKAVKKTVNGAIYDIKAAAKGILEALSNLPIIGDMFKGLAEGIELGDDPRLEDESETYQEGVPMNAGEFDEVEQTGTYSEGESMDAGEFGESSMEPTTEGSRVMGNARKRGMWRQGYMEATTETATKGDARKRGMWRQGYMKPTTETATKGDARKRGMWRQGYLEPTTEGSHVKGDRFGRRFHYNPNAEEDLEKRLADLDQKADEYMESLGEGEAFGGNPSVMQDVKPKYDDVQTHMMPDGTYQTFSIQEEKDKAAARRAARSNQEAYGGDPSILEDANSGQGESSIEPTFTLPKAGGVGVEPTAPGESDIYSAPEKTIDELNYWKNTPNEEQNAKEITPDSSSDAASVPAASSKPAISNIEPTNIQPNVSSNNLIATSKPVEYVAANIKLLPKVIIETLTNATNSTSSSNRSSRNVRIGTFSIQDYYPAAAMNK